MNKQAIYHSNNLNYSYFLNNKFHLILKVSKDDTFDELNIIYGPKYYFQQKEYRKIDKLYYLRSDDLFSYYKCVVDIKEYRIAYIFQLKINNKVYYYSQIGIFENKYNYDLSYFDFFQFSNALNDQIKIYKEFNKLSIYQIFIDRFMVGNTKHKEYVNLKIDELPNSKSFFGGDLKGIYNSLEYIKSLGFNAIYLTPIFKSISNHKYDIYDYFNIDKQFGNKKDLKLLVDKAHKLGIKIILDMVFNHCSNKNKIFLDVKKHCKTSRFSKLFFLKNIKDNKFDYETYFLLDYMPRLNTNNIETQKYFEKVAKYYATKFSIDVFRLDVCEELSKSFLIDLNKSLKQINPNIILFGENWHLDNTDLNPNIIDSQTNYFLLRILMDFYKNNVDLKKIINNFNKILNTYNPIYLNRLINILDCHDTDRFYSVVNKNYDKYLSAYTINFFFPGVPLFYYGDEIPLEGGFDPDNRRPFNMELVNKNSKIYKLIIFLNTLRRNHLIDLDTKIYEYNNLLCIERFNDKKSFKLYINNSNEDISFECKKLVLYSNLFDKNKIEKDGFLIIEEDLS